MSVPHGPLAEWSIRHILDEDVHHLEEPRDQLPIVLNAEAVHGRTLQAARAPFLVASCMMVSAGEGAAARAPSISLQGVGDPAKTPRSIPGAGGLAAVGEALVLIAPRALAQVRGVFRTNREVGR